MEPIREEEDVDVDEGEATKIIMVTTNNNRLKGHLLSNLTHWPTVIHRPLFILSNSNRLPRKHHRPANFNTPAQLCATVVEM